MVTSLPSSGDPSPLQLLLDAVSDYAIFLLDLDGRVASWNAGARRFKGYEESEILGSHFSCFYPLEDRQAGVPARALETAARDGRFEIEGWRLRKDGSRFWAHVTIVPVRDASGKMVGFGKITRDLTERLAAHETLRQSEDQFRRLVQAVSDYAIFMLDVNGRIITWNVGAQKIKGYRPDEIVGEHFSRFLTEEDIEAGLAQRALDIAAREGRYEAEAWRVRKDGSRFWASVVLDPIRDAGGRLIGYAKVTRDNTERLQAQAALDKAREALFQSQKIEALGKLTGGVAHDFNNLLMAILGSLELVRKYVPDHPKALSFIDNATRAAERGAALTQRMLAFARQQKLELKPVDLAPLVRGMLDLLKRSIGSTISVETMFPSDLPLVQTDSNQLELVLLNLATNARDAMPNGGSILITAREEWVDAEAAGALKPGHYVCLSVEDTGEGMDAELLARATEPFFTTKMAGKGTGLGLSMALGICQQSGGQLILSSRKGQGTTVEIWLPVAASLQTPVEDHEALKHPPMMPSPERSLAVLAVDDDLLVLTNTSAMLEDLGHRVVRATSGPQALDLIGKSESFDLVITDHLMPFMTGLQLAAEIRARWPCLPIILATGCSELPPDPFPDLPKLAKPFRQRELAGAVAEVLRLAP